MNRLIIVILIGFLCRVAGFAKTGGFFKQRELVHVDVSTMPGLHIGAIGQIPAFALKSFDSYAKKSTFTLGYGYGFSANYYKNKLFGFHAQFNYSEISQNYLNINNENRSIRISYLAIPMLVSVNSDFYRKTIYSAALGPEFGVLVGTMFEGIDVKDYTNVNSAARMASFGVGLAYQLGVTHGIGQEMKVHWNAGIKGVYGNTNCIGLYIGLMYKL